MSSSLAVVRATPSSSRFRSSTHQAYFKKLQKVSITESRTLDQSKLKWEIEQFFVDCSLLYFLHMSCAYNSTALREIYANMDIDPGFTKIVTRVMNRNVEFTREDLNAYLELSLLGENIHANLANKSVNCSLVNQCIRDSACDSHLAPTNTLSSQAKTVQHVLRNSFLPKAGDRDNITPVLSLTTYYILEDIAFDACSLLIGYISSVMSARSGDTQRLQNLSLGHIFAFLLEHKYNLVYLTAPDKLPILFSNNNFTLILKKRGHEGADRGRGVRVRATGDWSVCTFFHL